ncbi:MAG: cation-translocating P-type ATPase [Spirochaetia bacterium]|nr:cation-translocating P-type ATPase [Spirochaetia bacterium]
MSKNTIYESKNWHILSNDEIFSALKSNNKGLSENEATKRLLKYGPNELTKPIRISAFSILLEQFKNVLIIILLAATIVSMFLGHGIEAAAITIIVFFAVILGFIQEYKAENAIEALRKMAAPVASVIRENKEKQIPAAQIARGDILLIKAGDKIPADIRLLEAVNLKVDEAALTGESNSVEKNHDRLKKNEIPVADRKNMVYAGTTASYGRGKGIAVETGMNTEFGKIATMLESVEKAKTPLQKNLDKLGSQLAKAAFILVIIIAAMGIWHGKGFIEMLLFAIALAVAVVPEALPAVVTISLALGVKKMVKKNALMRRLAAVETLGCISYICSDKTGTLTKDEMTARKIYTAGMTYDITGSGYKPFGKFFLNHKQILPEKSIIQTLKAAALCSDAYIVHNETETGWEVKGDPTEIALVVAAAKSGLSKTDLEIKNKRVNEIPFTSESKRMSTLHEEENKITAYAKGAPEIIINSCSHFLTKKTNKTLSINEKNKLLKKAQEMASQAFRVLAVAYKPSANIKTCERDMIFLGLIGIIDPPRPEVKNAIETCKLAGIKPVMITGDHPLTAKAIAVELGLLQTGKIITGTELDKMSDIEFENNIENIEVYARVSPKHKLRVVTFLQKKEHIVAMTGDGVNDAPALKKADIGIAMGITGTDVTKEASSMTLTDDNFASIVAAIEEGRGIFDNIKKYLMYLLSSNIGEIGLIAAATFLGMPMPLTAVQILYVNLATDGLPALALAVDPPSQNLMKQKPRESKLGIFTKPVVVLMVIGGIWSTVINISLFIWALNSGRSIEESMTMTFVSLVLIQFFKAYNFRSDKITVFKKPFANKWLNMAILWEMLLLLLIVYIPFLHKPFGTFSLTADDWIIIISLALTIIPVLEIIKALERKGWLENSKTLGFFIRG